MTAPTPPDRHLRLDELHSLDDLRAHLSNSESLAHLALQGIDLSDIERATPAFDTADLTDLLMLGCRFRDATQKARLRERGALIFPAFSGLPYDPYRGALYTVGELMEGYAAGGYVGSHDFAIYTHSDRARRAPGGKSIREALAQRLHDHAVDDALSEYLSQNRGQGVVAVMGGHGMARSDPAYRAVARVAWGLTKKSYLVVSGGGPGVMEATNLGAWLSGFAGPEAIDEAIEILGVADTMTGGHAEGTPEYLAAVESYIAAAQGVLDHHGRDATAGGRSLAVPTWFYGHEPSNLFSAAVAKYFDNSIREEGLLAMADAGVIYAPGAAGTMQEIFQDLCQNHYATHGARSAMVFFGSRRYRREYELIGDFVAERGMGEVYGDMLALLDDPDEVIAFIEAHPARPKPVVVPLYELAGIRAPSSL